jgi:hypothetical protein
MIILILSINKALIALMVSLVYPEGIQTLIIVGIFE